MVKWARPFATGQMSGYGALHSEEGKETRNEKTNFMCAAGAGAMCGAAAGHSRRGELDCEVAGYLSG